MKYYEDLEIGEVESFGGRTVSREETVGFAEEYDPQPFHIDDEAARDSIFGGLIASGWHTATVTMRMLVDNFFSGTAFRGSIGIDELRWKRPVYPGDTLSVEAEITEKEPYKGSLGLAHGNVVTKNQDGEVVMTMVGLLLFEMRDPPE